MGAADKGASGNHADRDELCYRDDAKSGFFQGEREKLVSSDESEDEIDIDTLLQRPNASCHQQFTDFSNVFKAFIGSALIGLPFAIKNSGIILGLAGIVLIAIATDHCCNLIVKCKRLVIKKMCKRMAAEGYAEYHIERQEKLLGRTLSFGQIGKVSMGRLGTFLVDTSIIITQFGFCIGYFIFLGNTTRSVVYELLHYHSVGFSNMSDSIPLNTTSFSSTGMILPTTVSNYVPPDVPLKTNMKHASKFKTLVQSVALASTRLPNVTKSLGDTNLSTVQNMTSTSFLQINASTALFLTNATSTNKTSDGFISSLFAKLHVKVSTIKDKIVKMKNPITHATLQKNKAWTFALLLAVPAPLLVLISFIRNLRKLGPVSVLANGSITGAFLATAIYILVVFESPHETITWVNWMKFPIFFGQVTGAFEGIGTVIPIEGSMAENRGRYPCYLHISLFLLSSILGSFGILGYLRYGEETNQIVTENLQGSLIVIALRCLLFFGVLFTYPLQIYPVIQIVEGLIFGPNTSCSRRRYRKSPTVNGGLEGSSNSDILDDDEDEFDGAIVKIPTWQSNLVRMVLVLFTAVIAVVFRSQFAYMIALTGSVGSSLLSYILPCLFHILLERRTLSKWIIAKNVAFIVFGVIGGGMGLTVTILEIVRTFGTHHKLRHP